MAEDVGIGAEQEVEIKLQAPHDTLKALFEADIGGTATQVGRGRKLTSVYFDTADRRLLAKRFSFRVRRTSDRFIQTVKHDVPGPERLEAEMTVPALAPQLDALADHPVRPRLGVLFQEELKPVFATDVLRRTRKVTLDDGLGRLSEVELALDSGKISHNGRSEPISELEVELKSGDKSAVFEVAHLLSLKAPARLETRSKARRGYALADGIRPAPEKAAKAKLERDVPLGEALGRVFDNCFAHWWANHEAAFDGADTEGVHQLRVAIRRLRSVLTVFGPLLAPNRLAWLKTEARWVIQSLGPARNLDVFVTEMLPPVSDGRPNDPAISALRSVLEDQRNVAYTEVRDTLSSQRYTQFVLALGHWIASRGWYADANVDTHRKLGQPLGPFADAVLAKRHKVVKKRGRGFDELDAPAKHEVRIALKKLRYTLDFFRDLYPEAHAKGYLKHLSQLQDAFGHMNDMATADELLQQVAGDAGEPRIAQATGLVLGWYAHAQHSADEALSEGWSKFKGDKPFWSEPGSC